MKIRNGFVSNSSSSSFIVAFPEKPRSKEDVLKFMFNGKEGGVSGYDNDGLSYDQVAEKVFADISDPDKKAATKKEMIEQLSGRYHYFVGGNVIIPWASSDNDGTWLYKTSEYFGSDKKLMDGIKRLNIEIHNQEIKQRNKVAEYLEAKIGTRVPYASNSKDKDGKPYYSQEQIKAWEKYEKREKALRKNDKEFKKLENEIFGIYRDSRDEIRKLEEKLAAKDLASFMKNAKGYYFVILSYSDNDGSVGSTMEHGDIFRNLKHIWISNH